ncbi:Helix-turn-helix domain-containing protein [Bordetella tumbae]|uniref:helix-turn-helix domain-containing protein n=1 Tax=Bordetella tumbae TaxID=1649139 RepID=UPI0039EED194
MDMSEIGAIIRERRQSRALTQADLARKGGVSRATLSALENGQLAELGISRLSRLLEVLGLTLQVAQAEIFRPTLDELNAMNNEKAKTRSRERYRG